MFGRTYRGSFNAVVHAEEAQVHFLVTPSRLLQHLGELATNGLSMVGETCESNPHPLSLDHVGFGMVEDVEIRMRGETRMGNPRPLVVPGHHKHGHACFGDLCEGPKRLEHKGWGHSGPVKDVPSVDYQVDLPSLGWGQGQLIVGLEVVSPSPSLHSRAKRQVKP